MNAVSKLRRLAEQQERVAKLALASAERERAAQELVVNEASAAITSALHCGATDPNDHLHRHGYALRMEMARRGALRRLEQHTDDVGQKREQVRIAAREKGTLEKIVERQEHAMFVELNRAEQHRLDETGLLAWWRKD